jgi:hypothetical protein
MKTLSLKGPVAFTALIAIIAAIFWPRDRGPVYGGRSTADWVKEALSDDSASGACEVVFSIGAPAVPFIARQGLHDRCHRWPFLSIDRTLIFSWHHPRLAGLMERAGLLQNCVMQHGRACWMLSRIGTNAQAAIPDVADCLEHCPNQHYIDGLELVDTLGDISGTNLAAIPCLTRCARGTHSLCLHAAAVAYSIDGKTNLLLETCRRLAVQDLEQLLGGEELFRLRGEEALNQHLVPFFKALAADPRLTSQQRESAILELDGRGVEAPAGLPHLSDHSTNSPPEAGPSWH